jgi:hypothetical protein
VCGEDRLQIFGGLAARRRLLGQAGRGHGPADRLRVLDFERRERLRALFHLGDLRLEGRQVGDEQVDHLRVVVLAPVPEQELDGLFARQAFAVLTVFAHGVEAVDDR